ncbi:MAG: hypothetical protein WD511_00860 [Balneolaceae bacterium]
MIREVAIEPELIIEWSKKDNRREYKPFDLRNKYGFGSPTRMSRYPKKWRRLIGDLIADIEDPLQQKRIEELAKAVIENSIKRFGYFWNSTKSWYDNVQEEHNRLPFEAILCRANFKAIEQAISLQDFIDENEEKLSLLKISPGITPLRNSENLVKNIKPWLLHCKKILIIDPFFDPNRKSFSEPLKKLIDDVLIYGGRDSYPFLEIVRKHDAMAPSIEHLKSGFEEYIIDDLPEGFEIYFTVLEEIQAGEKLHNRYILSEIGGVKIEPGFDTQDDPNGAQTYDINLLSEVQYLKRWEQYYLSNNTFELKHNQLIITNQGITEN